MRIHRTVAEVAALVGGRVVGPGDRHLAELRPLDDAGPEDLAAVFRPGAAARARDGRAGCLLVAEAAAVGLPGRCLVLVPDAAAALDALVTALAPRATRPPPGVHPSAVVEPGALLGPEVAVGPCATVGAGARLGARCVLGPGSHVGEGAVLGEDCELQARAVVAHHCVLGRRVRLKPGAVVGADGFGFTQDAEGRHLPVPQLGHVELGDDVELGANSTVDRARFGATRIGRGCKLDARVHVAHNCVLGEDCALAGGVGLAGSCTLEARVLMGGLSGAVGGIVLRAGTRVGAMSMVMHSTEPGSYVVGNPAVPQRQWARGVLALQRLARRRGGAS